MERQFEVRFFSRKIYVKPPFGLSKNGQLFFFVFLIEIEGEIFLSLKPQAGQPFFRRPPGEYCLKAIYICLCIAFFCSVAVRILFAYIKKKKGKMEQVFC